MDVHHDQQWKRELAKFADEIASTDLADGGDFFASERPIFYSASIVRKLIEDMGVTDKLKTRFVEVTAHPSTRQGQPFFYEALLGPQSAEDHFDLETGRPLRLSYTDLASEIIHSDGFVWDINAPPPHAFAVFSHRNALDRLLYVKVNQYLEMLRAVLADSPNKWWSQKNLASGTITRHAE